MRGEPSRGASTVAVSVSGWESGTWENGGENPSCE